MKSNSSLKLIIQDMNLQDILIMIYAGIRTGEMLNIKTENVFIDKRIMYGGIKNRKRQKQRFLLLIKYMV